MTAAEFEAVGIKALRLMIFDAPPKMMRKVAYEEL